MRQDVFDFTEKIDPKSKNFQFWKLFFFLLSLLTFNTCRLSGGLLSCGDVNHPNLLKYSFK